MDWDKWLLQHKHTINPDGSVDIDGDVNLSEMKLKELPFKFGKVEGYFDCSSNQLTSLQGAPSEVRGVFNCFNNQLTSLQGAPSKVRGDFYCSDNQLTSLQGAPSEVGGGFFCSYNQLTSLQGAPSKVGKSFFCHSNPKLKQAEINKLTQFYKNQKMKKKNITEAFENILNEIASQGIISFKDFFKKKRGTRQQRGFTGQTRLHQNLVPTMHKIDPSDNEKVEDLRGRKEGDATRVLTPQDLGYISQKYDIRNAGKDQSRLLGKTGIKLHWNSSLGGWCLTKEK
jgi:hypothetical protein